jgi:hypothetical protein
VNAVKLTDLGANLAEQGIDPASDDAKVLASLMFGDYWL